MPSDPNADLRALVEQVQPVMDRLETGTNSRPGLTPEAHKNVQIVRWVLAVLKGQLGPVADPVEEGPVEVEIPPVEPVDPPVVTPEPPANTGGVWVSVAHVKSLPAPPAIVTNAAKGSVIANLADNNSNTDAATYANALLAVRGDNEARAKAVAGIRSMKLSGFARVLEMSRNIPLYVFAADLLNFHDEDAFLKSLVTKSLQGHSGAGNMVETAHLSATNWGGMATAACSAIALHTGDAGLAHDMAGVMRAWAGETRGRFRFDNTTWHHTTKDADRRGVNPRGSARSGLSIDGVQPEDQRRGGEFSTTPTPTGYQWEGLTPRIWTAVMLQQAGLLSVEVGDEAIRRAILWNLNVCKFPLAGDDVTVSHLIRRFYGVEVPTGDSIFKNMAFCGWTHKS